MYIQLTHGAKWHETLRIGGFFDREIFAKRAGHEITGERGIYLYEEKGLLKLRFPFVVLCSSERCSNVIEQLSS